MQLTDELVEQVTLRGRVTVSVFSSAAIVLARRLTVGSGGEPPACITGVGANTVTAMPRPTGTCSTSSWASSTTACNNVVPSTRPRRSRRRSTRQPRRREIDYP